MKNLFIYTLGVITPILLVLVINTAEKYHHKNGRPIWDDLTNKMHTDIPNEIVDYSTK